MIVLTGATGSLGSNLLSKLLSYGYEVAAIVKTNSSLARIEKWKSNENIKLYNLEEINPRIIFEENKIDVIVHTATEYGRGGDAISKILEPNLILPVRLIELGIEHDTACFINTGSYFNNGGSPYFNLLNYSLSKKSLWVWLKRLLNQIRIVNVTLEHNFVYVDEVADAFIKLIEYGRTHEFTFKNFEVGTGESVQVRDFAQMISDLSCSPSSLGFGDVLYRSDEIMDSKADISPLLELGWVPKIGIREGLVQSYGVTVDVR